MTHGGHAGTVLGHTGTVLLCQGTQKDRPRVSQDRPRVSPVCSVCYNFGSLSRCAV